jgi:S1-C subfamily serine protease
MLLKVSPDFKTSIITITAASVCGALAGAAAGWMFSALPYELPFASANRNSTATTTASVKTVPTVEVVPVDRKPVEPILPPAFTSRRVSSVAGVYRRAPNSPVLSDAQLLGEAVAVTSDGWLAMPAAAVNGMKLADIILWRDGVAATATRGIIDERSSVVFLKTPFTNLQAPAFARYEDITPGIPVWIERRAGSYEPATVASLHGDIGDLNGIPSTIASRRPTVTAFARTGDVGAPVWDSNGTLLGIASGKPGDAFPFIPASAWAPSLYGIFSDGVVLDADLGVRSLDLSALRLVANTSTLPELGAWIVPDKAAKLPAVDKNSPAASAGIREGDVITSVDRDILDGSADLGEILVQYKPGSRVTLTVSRDGKTLELPVTLGSVPVSRELK